MGGGWGVFTYINNVRTICFVNNIYIYQIDTKKRNFWKSAEKWPKAIIPDAIDKTCIGVAI